jgi:phenylacetate-CoA ligase
MFWDIDAETIKTDTLRLLQLERLRRTINQLYLKVPFYQQKLAIAGVKPSALKTLDDVRRLPFTTNQDLRDNYPRGLLAVASDKVIRLHTSSGTTGKPKALFFSRRDINQSAELIARCLVMSGAGPQDVLQNMMTYGLFTGALVLHYGAEKIGMLIIPAGPGNSEKQLLLMQDFGTTVFHTTPSYALYLADFLEKRGIDPKRDLKLRKGFIGAEPYTEETRLKIEQAFGIEVYNSYGLSEMNGPGVAFECNQKHGMHLWEDNFLMEVVNPKTDEPVKDGEPGELILTTLCREAMPLIRYRTRDITSIIDGPCSCGRSHRRINRITGRADDMLIIRGANVYPQQIERILMAIPEVGRNYLILLEGLDEMTVKVELSATGFDGQVGHLVHLQTQIAEKLRSEIQVKPKVDLVPPGTLPASEGKAKRVIDKRVL